MRRGRARTQHMRRRTNVLCARPKAALGTARNRSCTRTLARSLARRPARMHEVADSRRVLLCERYIHRANARACARAVRATE